MVISISDLVIEINLIYENEFKTLGDYKTDKKPSFFINSSFNKFDLELNNPFMETEFYDKFRIGNKIIQRQKNLNGKVYAYIEYDGNKINIYNDENNNFYDEYLLSQYAIFDIVCSNTDSILFHSSTIKYNDIGIAFSAKSGTGKSTHRRLWNKYSDAICINDDKNIITLDNNKLLISPNPWSGKHMVDNNITIELKAIVFLYQNKTNVVEELPIKKAFKLLLGQIELPKDDNIELWNNITDLMLKLPIYYYGCNMEKEAFTTIKERIDEDLCL